MNWIKRSVFAILSIIPYTQSYINIKYPDYLTTPQNVPLIDTQDYQVIPFIWDPSSKMIKFCVESKDFPVDLDLVQDAFDNINAQLYTGNFTTTSLYFMLDREKECNDNDLKIKFIQSRDSIKAPGYCTRKFLDGTINRPMILYTGCDITLNVCALQSSSSMYNVLLHELLHVVGLDHPEPPVDGSVISYGVRVNDSTLNNVIQDTNYVSLQPFDIMNMRFIALRDFDYADLPDPRTISSYIPKTSPTEHVSGTDDYIVNEVMNVGECWIQKNQSNTRPTLRPTSAISPTMQPTLRPTLRPTTRPTMRPTLRPTMRPTLRPTEQPTLQPTVQQSLRPTPQTSEKINKRRRRRQRRRRKQMRKQANASISTDIEPEISVNAQNTSNLNISTTVNPDITVNLLDGDVNMKTIVSPKINIEGNANSYNIITQVNPIINIKRRQVEVAPPPKQWDRFP